MRASVSLVLLTILLTLADIGFAHDLGIARVEVAMLDETRFEISAKLSASGNFSDPGLSEGCEILAGRIGNGGAKSRWHHWLIACNDKLDPGKITLNWDLQGAMVEVQSSSGGSVQQYHAAVNGDIVLDPGNMLGDSRSATEQARHFLKSGFIHILIGIDHLMFVALLTFLARSWDLLKLVTAFTIGHSLTLALAVLGWVQVPLPPIEALIALSIAFLARNVLLGHRRAENGLPLVMLFGLIHGLGFASVMDVQGLSGNDLVMALLFFNLGIEAGQIVVIATLLFHVWLFNRLADKNEKLGRAVVQIIATFALLYFSGFTINLMTLGGLALGVGMMVDSSVVVLENIYRRHQEHNEEPSIAAVEGTSDVSSAVIAGTLTTLVIFLPLVFVQGIAGELFKELAYVIMFSLLCALLVALGLLPMLAAKLMAATGRTDRAPHTTADSTTLQALANAYHALLVSALRHRLLTVVVAASILASVLLLIPYLGTEFLPPSDEGEVRITGEMEEGTHLDLVDAQAQKLEKMIGPLVPEAVSSVVSVMASGTRGSAKARVQVNIALLPAAQRSRSNTAIADDLRKRLSGQIPGMKIRTRAPQGQFLLERLLKTTEGVVVEVRGFNMETLNLLANQVSTAINQIDGVTDVELSREQGIPQQEILIDRAKAADLGLSVRDLLTVIETAVAGSKAGEYRVEGNSYRILVQLEDAEHRSIDEILNLTVPTPGNENVALRNLVTTSYSYGPVTIERKDRQRLVTVTANVSGRDLGSVASEVQTHLDRIARPPGYDLLVTGNYEEQQKAFEELIISLLLALLLVYMVLAAQYESLRDPLIVLLSVPLAAIGVILTLFMTDTTLNLQSAIGCIMLGGIVVNNAILLVDQAGRLRRRGMNTYDALAEAGRRRLRPILMTTLTTILALLPLALGIGEGADAQAPLARVVIGGLTASTLITLVLVPVVYTMFHPSSKPS